MPHEEGEPVPNWTPVGPGVWVAQMRLERGDEDWFVIVRRADKWAGKRRTFRVGSGREDAQTVATQIMAEWASEGSEAVLVSQLLAEFLDFFCLCRRPVSKLGLEQREILRDAHVLSLFELDGRGGI